MNFKKKVTFYLLVFGIMITLVASTIVYFTFKNNYIDAISSYMNEKLEYKEKYFFDDISQYGKFIQSFQNTLFVRDIRANNLKDLTDYFQARVDPYENIEQLRLLDPNGLEIVRVNNKENKLTNALKLQDKSDRYYYKEAVVLEKGALYYSKIDLNMENGQIEIPYMPTIRIATKLFVEDKFYILILNINLKESLERLS